MQLTIACGGLSEMGRVQREWQHLQQGVSAGSSAGGKEVWGMEQWVCNGVGF